MFDVSYGGFVNGDTSAALAGALVFNFAAHPPASYGPSPVMPTNVATYSVRPSGLTSGNYTITYHAGTVHHQSGTRVGDAERCEQDVWHGGSGVNRDAGWLPGGGRGDGDLQPDGG